jgi:hypothetical protein
MWIQSAVKLQTPKMRSLVPSQHSFHHLLHRVAPSSRDLEIHLQHLLCLSDRSVGSTLFFQENDGLHSADVGQDQVPVDALDSLLCDMEAGKEASALQAPHDYRSSMVSLSNQSLVPVRVVLRRPQDSQKVETSNDRAATNNVDMNTSQITIQPSSPKGGIIAHHNSRASRSSAYSSSVYSEHSSTTTDTKERNTESSSSSETKARPLDPKDARGASADGITPKSTHPVDAHGSNLSPNTLTPRPLQLSQLTHASLIGNSPAHQCQTFLLDDSSSESKPSSPSTTHQSSESKGITKDKSFETSSDFASCGSSEDISESKIVRSYTISYCSGVDIASRRSVPVL